MKFTGGLGPYRICGRAHISDHAQKDLHEGAPWLEGEDTSQLYKEMIYMKTDFMGQTHERRLGWTDSFKIEPGSKWPRHEEWARLIFRARQVVRDTFTCEEDQCLKGRKGHIVLGDALKYIWALLLTCRKLYLVVWGVALLAR